VAPLSKQNFSDRRNLSYDKSASFRNDARLFHSPGPAAANALSLKGCMSASQRMFDSLWNVVVAHEHRQHRQSSARYHGEIHRVQTHVQLQTNMLACIEIGMRMGP